MKIYIKDSVSNGNPAYEWTNEEGRALKVSGVAKTKEEVIRRAKRMFHTEDIELITVSHF